MVRSRIVLPLSAAWFLLILSAYHFGEDAYPPGRLGSLLLDLLLLCVIGAAAWGLGSILIRPLRLAELSPGEAPLYELGAGLGGLALMIFVVSAAGLLYRWVVILLLALCLVPLLAMRRSRSASTPRGPLPDKWTSGQRWLLVLPLAAGATALACSLAPPEFYDALIYHLAVPDLYIRHHGMVPVPGNYYASYPANMGMLYAMGLLLRGGELAQSIHWLCGALATAALFTCSSRHTDRTTALLACALLALTPAVMLVSTWAIADLAVMLFGTLCFASVLNLWKEGDRRWLVAAGIFAGLALGTKYTAAVVVGAPAAAAIALRPVRAATASRARRALADVALFGCIAALLLSPWLLRNLVFTGNPLAPYLSEADAGGSPDIAEEMRRRLPRGEGPVGLAAHYLAAPWNATMKRLGAGGYLGPAFLMLVPLILFMRGLPAVTGPVALMAVAGIVGWALSSQVTRYLLPLLPLLALLAAVAARGLHKALILPALGWSLLYNLFLFMFLVETIGGYRVVAGAESAEEYLSRRVSYYPAMAFLSRSPPDTKVLFVGEGRGFYCPRPYLASTPFDAPLLDLYAAQATGEQALLDRLRSEGITHLLVSGPELKRTRQIGADELMARFFPSGSPRLVFERRDVRLYALPG